MIRQRQKMRTKRRFQRACAWTQSNLTRPKKLSFIFVCGLVIPETLWSDTASLSWMWEGQGRNEFSQSTQGNYSRIMSCFPWMIKRSHDNSSHLCISLLFPASTVWFSPSENNDALSEEIKISRSNAALLCSCS